MTALLRHPLDGRGRRSNETLLQISERDHLLRDARRRFCVGMSARQSAAMLRTALMRYQTGRWRRSRADLSCPHHAQRIDALLWMILKVRDAVPSERNIRRVLAFRGPRAVIRSDHCSITMQR